MIDDLAAAGFINCLPPRDSQVIHTGAARASIASGDGAD
jgi:hypothetical protein